VTGSANARLPTGALRATSFSTRNAFTSEGSPNRSRSPPKVMIDGARPARPPEKTSASKSYRMSDGEAPFHGGAAGDASSVHVRPSRDIHTSL